MVVVAPFCKVIGKVEPGRVGGCVFKVNDDKLLMLVGGLEQWRFFIVGTETKNIAVLSLGIIC